RRGRALRLDLAARLAEGIEVVGELRAQLKLVAGYVERVERAVEVAAVEVRPRDLPGGIDLRQLRAGDCLELVLRRLESVARRLEVRVAGERHAHQAIEIVRVEQPVP